MGNRSCSATLRAWFTGVSCARRAPRLDPRRGHWADPHPACRLRCVTWQARGKRGRQHQISQQKFEVYDRSPASSRPCSLVSRQKSSVCRRKLVVPDANQPVPNASQPVPDGNQPIFIAADCFWMKTRSKRPPSCRIPVRNSHFPVPHRRNHRLRAHRDQQHDAPPSKNGIHDAETTGTH